MEKSTEIQKGTTEKKMTYIKAGFAKKPVKGRNRSLLAMLRQSKGDILTKTRLSLKTCLSIQISCLMEIMEGKEAEAKKGLRQSEVGTYNRYMQMTPQEREIELKKLNGQFVSLIVPAQLVGVGY